MQIKYHGNTTFSIKGKNTLVVLNPEEKLKGDLALYSTSDHAEVTSESMVDWPGEYEVKEVLVHGVEVPHGDKKTILYNFELDEIKVLYLPNLDHVLDDKILEQIGDTDVLLIPVGGNGALDAKTAAKVYEDIEPKVVIPMQHSEDGYAAVGDFLKEVGKTGLEFSDDVKLSKTSLPVDSTDFYVLSQV